MVKTSIIILTYNNLNYTKACLKSILKYTPKDTYEIIVVDNNSSDGTKEWLKKQKNIKTIFNKCNLGFPKGCNQALAIAEAQNDILFLNNDTIVTDSWLENLKKCLYSDEKIGACGSVCNQWENNQGVNFTYQNLESMQQFAKTNNVSDSNKWEEKVFLIGFCLLIKRKVIDLLGGLDEEYTPGYIEDNDLSLRILKLNYRLFLCHDSFIHHYLGTSFRSDLAKFYPILNKNRCLFSHKWHFQTFEFDNLKYLATPFLEKKQKILDLNCGLGTNALYIKYHYQSEVDGVEKNKCLREFSQKVIKVFSSLNQVQTKYDLILIGDELEKVKNPQKFLKKLQKRLNPEGSIVGEIKNPYDVKNLYQALSLNTYTMLNQLHYFHPQDIQNLILKLGFQKVTFYPWTTKLNPQELLFQKQLNFPFTQYSHFSFKIDL